MQEYKLLCACEKKTYALYMTWDICSVKLIDISTLSVQIFKMYLPMFKAVRYQGFLFTAKYIK